MRKIGYMRLTINEQDTTNQEKNLKKFGVDRLVKEETKPNGGTPNTSSLQLLLEELEAEDILVVTELKRLGRSTRQLAELTSALQEKNLHLISLKEDLDTREETGQLYFNFLDHLAQMECDLIKERTLVGLSEARKKGKVGGRPKIDPKVVKKIRRLYYDKKETIQFISNKCHVSVGTCYKYINLSDEDVKQLFG